MSWALVKSKSARKRAACRGPQQEHRKKTATLPNRPRHRWSSGPAEDLAKILTLENALPPRRYCNQKGACASFQPNPGHIGGRRQRWPTDIIWELFSKVNNGAKVLRWSSAAPAVAP